MMRDGDAFRWHGENLRYLVHPYNRAGENERAVEVPIARAFLDEVAQEFGPDARVLEVGHVLGHYDPHGGDVIDLHEVADGVRNVDLFDIVGEWDAVVSISTVEHVRWGNEGAGRTGGTQDPAGAVRAVEHLRSLVAPRGRLLVSAPFGQNPYLDGAILACGLGADDEASLTYETDRWDVHPGERVWRPARPRTWAGSVWVGAWRV